MCKYDGMYTYFWICGKHVPELVNDVSVVKISRYGLARGTLLDECVLTFILLIITSALLKVVLNWTVVTYDIKLDGS
jgi:hypothetical protein